MHEALFYKKLKNQVVQCQLCPNYCTLKESETGKCYARRNMKGKLIALGYRKIAAMHVDPLTKKPIYHMLLGSKAFSIGTAGCNLACTFCQNFGISQVGPDEVQASEVKAEEVIKLTKNYDCKSIAYTFTEPFISIEYFLEIAKLAKKAKLKNVLVSNGYINQEPLKQLCKYIDAANIDLKAMSDSFYRKYCSGRLEPILEAIKTLHKEGVWVEITNLLIPGLNDKPAQVKKVAEFVKSVSADMPLHFSAFYPCYKMMDKPRTHEKTVLRAREIALKLGLKYVYTGNVLSEEGNSTYCPNCKKVVLKRITFDVVENNIKDGKCKFCGETIAGVYSKATA